MLFVVRKGLPLAEGAALAGELHRRGAAGGVLATLKPASCAALLTQLPDGASKAGLLAGMDATVRASVMQV